MKISLRLPYDQSLDSFSKIEISKLLRTFLYTIPIVAIVLSVVNFTLGFSQIAFIILSVPAACGVSLLALNRGYINISITILISILIAATTMSCVLGNGIHETGVIVFPVIVLFSSLVMNVRGVIITTVTVIMCMAFIVFGEIYNLYPSRNVPTARFLDLIVVLTITVIHIFVTHNFSRITKTNLKRAQKELNKQKRYRDEMSKNLKEKSDLLRLVHHRVKNNLLLINSLIDLETFENKEARKELREVNESIHTIARAHDPLYHSEDYKQVAIKPYLEKLIVTISQPIGLNKLKVSLQDGLLFHDKALLIGIILQKILNQLENPENQETTINFSLDRSQIKLEISAPNSQFESLDISLIELLSQSLKGKIERINSKITLIAERD